MKKRTYIRDGRAPVPDNENTSRVMSANKAKDTKPELKLRRALWKANIKGYRLHPQNIVGKPDITFIGKKVAIFVNGCFWHRCPNCSPSTPKSNVEFWEDKFRKNIKRDAFKIKVLINDDWKALTVWECQVENSLAEIVKTISVLVS